MSYSLWPPWTTESQVPWPSLSPRVCLNSCPFSRWCHSTISSSVTAFSPCPQSFPESGFFPVNQLFTSGGPSIGASASASILPMNIQGWFPLGWTGLMSLLSKGLSKSLLQHHNSKASILQCSAFFIVQLSHPYMTTGKTIALTIQTLVGKVMSLLFNKLSRFVMAFLPRSKSFDFVAAVTIHSDFGVQENKICHCFHFSPIYLHIYIIYCIYLYYKHMYIFYT